MAYMEGKNVLSGREGTAFITVDGQVKEIAYLKNIEASVELNKVEVQTLGRRVTQHKINGWSGTGSMNVYYVTSLFRDMIIDYIKKGKVTYFDIQVKNEDLSSTAGKQTTVLKNCLLNGAILTKLDIEADYLDEDIEFTFEDADIPDTFSDEL